MRVPTTTSDLARTDPTPLVGALAVAQRAVQERDVNVQIEAQPIEQRNGERDLRHEHERSPALLQRCANRLRVDARLAARGRAFEQDRLVSSRVDQLAQCARRPSAAASGRRGVFRARAALRQRASFQRPSLDADRLDLDQRRASRDREWRSSRGARPAPRRLPSRSASASSASSARCRGPSRDPSPPLAASSRPGGGEANPPLELLTRLRRSHDPLGLSAAVHLTRDPFDAFEHPRREHRAHDHRRRCQVVAGDVARQLDLERWQKRSVGAHPREDRLDLPVGRFPCRRGDYAQRASPSVLDEHGLTWRHGAQRAQGPSR